MGIITLPTLLFLLLGVSHIARGQTCQTNLLDCPSAGAEGTLFDICGVANLADNATTVNVGTGASVVNLGTVETLTSSDPYYYGITSSASGGLVYHSTDVLTNMDTGSGLTLGYNTDNGRFYPGELGAYVIMCSTYFHDSGTGFGDLRIRLNGVRLCSQRASETREHIMCLYIAIITDPGDYFDVNYAGRVPNPGFGSITIHRIPNS